MCETWGNRWMLKMQEEVVDVKDGKSRDDVTKIER